MHVCMHFVKYQLPRKRLAIPVFLEPLAIVHMSVQLFFLIVYTYLCYV